MIPETGSPTGAGPTDAALSKGVESVRASVVQGNAAGSQAMRDELGKQTGGGTMQGTKPALAPEFLSSTGQTMHTAPYPRLYGDMASGIRADWSAFQQSPAPADAGAAPRPERAPVTGVARMPDGRHSDAGRGVATAPLASPGATRAFVETGGAGISGSRNRVLRQDRPGQAPERSKDMDLGAAAQSSEPRQSSTGAPLAVQLANQGRAHPVLRQIAEQLPVNGSGSVEIRLNPDELGSVRMTLAPAEAGLTVHIQADRSETLDLIKRNIEQLARDLAEAGYEGAAFSFAGDERDARPRRDGERPATEAGLSASEESRVEEPSRTVRDGLDIRL